MCYRIFRLIYPNIPPSSQNHPLSNYIRLIPDYCDTKLLHKIIYIYIIYNQLTKIIDNHLHTSGDYLILSKFQVAVDKHTEYGILNYLRLDYTFSSKIELTNVRNFEKLITHISSATPFKPKVLAEYEFPNILFDFEYNQIKNIINYTLNEYMKLRTYDGEYYTTNGNIRIFSNKQWV